MAAASGGGGTGQRTALVLSGGGVRGAYAVGALAGLVEVLGLGPDDPPPFDIVTGTSVGAINLAWVASQSDRGDLGVQGLVDLWRSLRLGVHARVSAQALPRRAMLDVGPLEDLVRRSVDWERLHAQVDRGRLRALVVAALHVGSGRTALFSELAEGVHFPASRDPRRTIVHTRLTCDHVLASAAIPWIFPPRPVEGHLFWDGGLRFNTPISPAIRCGARRLVVISALAPPAPMPAEGDIPSLGPDPQRTPGIAFLAGKMLHAILMDPVHYDLEVLERFNALQDLLADTLAPDELERLDAAAIALRGRPYRHLHTLLLAPRDDLGALGVAEVRARSGELLRLGPLGWLLRSLGLGESGSDLASYLFFDGDFAGRLVERGHADVVARADEVRAFFAR
ncbi:MAG: patatin-like phospholipase family protein [Alphaproteobacteria bacterium]|nr:patatin-like phospholipase family protein [Alphaproteobacteria bacterium]